MAFGRRPRLRRALTRPAWRRRTGEPSITGAPPSSLHAVHPPGELATGGAPDGSATLAVLGNRRFLALWLSQVATQVGGNMVLYGLTVQIFSLTRSNTSVSLLILSFLVPAVIFSAIAGVFVDRFDRRFILISTNVARAVAFFAMVFVGQELALLYLLNIFVSTVTTFFAPAEASMIPVVVGRRLLTAANSLFIFTLQASFALGFALLGPLVVNLAGIDALLLLVAVLYLGAGALCMTLPKLGEAPTEEDDAVSPVEEAEHAVNATLEQLRYGIAYIRAHRNVFWPLSYLAITASLIGVLGVLGPAFAQRALGLREQDFVVVVLPLAFGLVMGILILNVYGRLAPRRRVIEGGLLGLMASLSVLSVAGPISHFLQGRTAGGPLTELGPLVSLLAIVVLLAFLSGVAYAFVAVPAQTQLQEELPEEVRGRVFGVLNMLVSIASFLPIIVVGPVADLVGTPLVILASALFVGAAGVASIIKAQPATLRTPLAWVRHAPVDPVAVATVPLDRQTDLGARRRAAWSRVRGVASRAADQERSAATPSRDPVPEPPHADPPA